MKNKMFLLFAVVVLFSISNSDYTYALPKPAESAQQAINNYIKGYIEGNFERIIVNDFYMLRNLLLKVQSFPEPYQEEEGEKELNRVIEELKKFEINKKTKGTSLTTSRRLLQQKGSGGGMNFFYILYPKMKYKILEVRDTPEADIILRADESTKMAFVQLSYNNPENSPFLDQKKDLKVKTVIVKVYLAVNEDDEQKPLFFVSSYFPTDYKRELFSEQETLSIELNDLDTLRAKALKEAREVRAKEKIDILYKNTVSAFKLRDIKTAKQKKQELIDTIHILELDYTLQIVSRKGTRSGVWRIPRHKPNERRYYLIVEAVTADGNRISLPVTSEEDGMTSFVDQWGLRVDPMVFERVKQDKMADGVINDNRVGKKQRGYLSPVYKIATTGAAITAW